MAHTRAHMGPLTGVSHQNNNHKTKASAPPNRNMRLGGGSFRSDMEGEWTEEDHTSLHTCTKFSKISKNIDMIKNI